MVRRVLMVGLAMLGLAASASAASAATLKIGVPRTVHKNKTYTITITGSFARGQTRGRGYLIAAIQFSGARCQRTAQQENNLQNAPQFYFGSQAGIWEKRSPFTRTDSLIAKARGSRHVCAYLYPRFVGPTSTIKPIATADASYSVR